MNCPGIIRLAMKVSKHVGFVCFLCLSFPLLAQFHSQILPPLKKLGTVNMSSQQPDYFTNWQSLQAPSPSGTGYRDFLERVKIRSAEKFPRKEKSNPQFRNNADRPLIIKDFQGNNGNVGIPLDNHLAISNTGRIVSVINNEVSVYDPSGNRFTSRSLEGFTSELETLSEFKFDPRVMYDHESDRFVIVMISGFECEKSEVIVAFSATANPSGNWHLYALEGCPFQDSSFADYPMIALTKKELFLTVNSVRENVSWQEGFVETLIWQMDKESAYAGEELPMRLWSEVEYGGQNIRNVCPIKAGDALKGDHLFLLSNRNFDIQNDSFFLLEITSTLDDPAVTLTVEPVLADVPYGVAPNAQQKFGFLATNDSRVLDGFYENDQIQFVMNCIDTTRGTAAIYHGIIDNMSADKELSGTVLTNGKDEFGYPGIAYAGLEAGDKQAIIVLAHSSRIRNVGWSAIYVDQDRNYSEITTIKEGQNFIDRLDQSLERWGDYIGIQRVYNQPGFVWAASTYGTQSKAYSTWIAKIARPDADLSSTDPALLPSAEVLAFPNPTTDLVTIQFELPTTEPIELSVLDQTGRMVVQFYRERPKNNGSHQFSFSSHALPGGIYYLTLRTGTQLISTKRFVVIKAE